VEHNLSCANVYIGAVRRSRELNVAIEDAYMQQKASAGSFSFDAIRD
jgi:hypothetical protein